jgi:hypothetical protein
MGAPDDRLAAECPRRVLGLLHASGRYVHLVRPDGRVCCFTAAGEVPDWPPSPAQAALDARKNLQGF